MEEFIASKTYPPFAASRSGQIKNLETGKIRTPSKTKTGYLLITMRKFSVYAHRIVADCFIPNPDNKPQVNHIDCNKSNNHVDNLEWCTRSENALHARDNGKLKLNCNYGEDCNLTKLTEQEVINICEDLAKGMRNCDVAKKYSISAAYVKTLKAGKQWKDITQSYTFIQKSKQHSEKTVRWICSQIVSGKGPTEISKLSGGKVLVSAIKNIKYGKIYRDISKEYF